MTRKETVRAPAPRARVLLSALTLLAMCCFSADANAADRISFISSSDLVSIVDAPNAINLGLSNSSILGPTTTTVSNPIAPPYSGTSTSSFSPTGTVGSTANFSIPIVNINSILRTTSEVRFTANEALKVSPLIGSGSGDVAASFNNVEIYRYGPPVFVVQTLFDVTANELVIRQFSSLGVPLPPATIDGMSPGPYFFPNPFATFLVAGHTYRHVLETESRPSTTVPTGPGLTFNNSDFKASGLGNLTLTPVAIPEPTTVGLLSLAAIGLAFRFRRAR
jgi:hypothetical protein